MSEKLVQAQNAQVEVVHFQEMCDTLRGQISSETYRIDATHNPLIQSAQNALDTAEADEKTRYSAYMTLENKKSDIVSEIQYYQDLHDTHPFTIMAIMDLVNIDNLNQELNAMVGTLQNAWLIYLDSVNLRETAESNYNAALLAKQNDGVYLDQLNRELVAATNSLNTWKIAYQAAYNVYTELSAQLGINVEPISTYSEALSTYYDSTLPNWYSSEVATSLQTILTAIGSNRTVNSFNYTEALAIINEWNTNQGTLTTSLSWVRGY